MERSAICLLLIGCLTMLVGVVFAMAQTDLKRLLAFHTVSQLGYVVTGLALGTSLGIAAGLFYAASHALFKGTLFMCAGAVQRATGTRDMRKLGGLSSRMPVTTHVWLVAAAAIVGVPLTNGFVAKWLLFDAALECQSSGGRRCRLGGQHPHDLFLLEGDVERVLWNAGARAAVRRKSTRPRPRCRSGWG